MFKISTAKFLPADIDSAANHTPGSPAHARFACPQPPITPFAARVHRLIMSAIAADLKVLEARFKKDSVRFPPVVLSFIGFLLLALFLVVFGLGYAWPQGLPILLFVGAAGAGVHILLSVLIRDMLTDLKAEHAVLVLSVRRVAARAPYHLSFAASSFVYRMTPLEWAFAPLVLPFGWWAIPLARRVFGIDAVPTQRRVLVAGPPPSLGGSLGALELPVPAASGSSTAAAWAERFVVVNGTLRPTVWTVVAELRVPASTGEAAVEVGVDEHLTDAKSKNRTISEETVF